MTIHTGRGIILYIFEVDLLALLVLTLSIQTPDTIITFLITAGNIDNQRG